MAFVIFYVIFLFKEGWIVLMKVLFLHIGDMHIKDRNGINSFQISKIADTFNSFSGIDKVVLIVAGDIAQSGTSDQYVHAKYLIGTLITAIKKELKYTAYNKIDVLCVPGNHDLNHNGFPMDSKSLQCIRENNTYDKYLIGELQKQESFLNFAKFNYCFTEDSIFSRRILTYGDFTIEVNLINSGVFSILEEDKGLHYIPQHYLSKISAPTGAQFVITIMHHAIDWYIDSQKNALEESIYSKSSLVFYGHEHYIRKKTVSYETNASTIIQAGGCLCKNENWSESAFHIGVLNSETLEYTHAEYTWNAHQKQYESLSTTTTKLPSKPSVEKKPNITASFMQELLQDKKHDISQDFRDYYVFPRIQSEDCLGSSNNEFTTENSFIEEILKKKKILISGGYNAGKTTLLRILFLRLSDMGYTVLFCDTDNIHGKKADRIIRNCFEDIYGENHSDYERYDQLSKSKKILIIDDIDQIKTSGFNSFLNHINEKFEYIVFSSKQLIAIDLFERTKTQLKAVDSIYRYKIMPMYSDKRSELIKKIVSIKANDQLTVPKVSKILIDAINAQRRFISLDPDFIIKYVEYYFNNVGDSVSSDSGVFSKVFEASLINAVNKYQAPRLSVDKTFILLSKVAHYIHFHKAYPISEHHIMTIVGNYNDEYGTDVNGTDFIKTVTQAHVLIFDELSCGYRFANLSYLAYFVAREVNSQYNDTGDDTDLQAILKYACFGINADILMFISYITDNIRILRLILHMANEYTMDWTEFNFDENIPQYLREERRHNVELPSPNAKQQEQENEVLAEKASDHELQTVDIYDYSDDDADIFVNQLIRAAQLLIIVARCLPNFEHSMPRTDKEGFVQAIYSLPNKIFYLWANEANKEIDNLIQFFKEQSQDYYTRQKKLSDDDIIHVLQWTSMSFLLDLYNLPVFFATRDNTVSYLSSFDYTSSSTYLLEHLMMIERQASGNSFISEAKNAVKGNTNFLFQTMVKRVVGHALVFRSDLDYSQINQLQTEFFPQIESQKKLLLHRTRINKKENE